MKFQIIVKRDNVQSLDLAQCRVEGDILKVLKIISKILMGGRGILQLKIDFINCSVIIFQLLF